MAQWERDRRQLSEVLSLVDKMKPVLFSTMISAMASCSVHHSTVGIASNGPSYPEWHYYIPDNGSPKTEFGELNNPFTIKLRWEADVRDGFVKLKKISVHDKGRIVSKELDWVLGRDGLSELVVRKCMDGEPYFHTIHFEGADCFLVYDADGTISEGGP